MTAEARPQGVVRRFQHALYQHPRVQLSILLLLPLGALVLIYFGSLVVLLLNAFWTLDPFTAQVDHTPSLANFQTIIESPTYRTITLRTVAMAGLVTITCAIIGFPIAYYIARIAPPRRRSLLVVAILLPLWASYLVKVFAWRAILQESGLLNWALGPLGIEGPGYGDVAVWLVFTYLWLPYMILPIVAGLERIPNSLLEASSVPGRPGRLHLPQGGLAAGPACRRGGFDLHVLADARGLHRAIPGVGHPVPRQRHLPRGRRFGQPATRGGAFVHPDHRHGRLPVPGAPPRRLRGTLT